MIYRKTDPSENIVNCRKNQLLSYLDAEKFPIKLLFYNSYEDTQKILEHLREPQKNRFNYKSNIINERDLHEIPGFVYKSEHFVTVNEAIIRIEDLLHQEKALFVFGDCFYLPHRLDHYNKTNSVHSILIASFLSTSSNEIKIIDDEFDLMRNTFGKKYTEYVYKEAVIKRFISRENGDITVNYFDNLNTPYGNSAVKFYFEKFQEFISNIILNFTIYEEMKNVNNDYNNFDWDDALRLLFGSRYFFREFVLYYHDLNIIYSQLLISQIDNIVQHLEIILNTYHKSLITKKLDAVKFEKKVYETYLLEVEFTKTLVKLFR